jgi:hypothetical protein
MNPATVPERTPATVAASPRTQAPDGRAGPLLALLALTLLGATRATAATLEADQYESREGYFQLFWDADESIRLVEAEDPDFDDAVVLYEGNDSGRVISGRPNGVWFYRLESADGNRELAGPISVTVRHHSLVRAFSFFGLGAGVFLATLTLIVSGWMRTHERA